MKRSGADKRELARLEPAELAARSHSWMMYALHAVEQCEGRVEVESCIRWALSYQQELLRRAQTPTLWG